MNHLVGVPRRPSLSNNCITLFHCTPCTDAEPQDWTAGDGTQMQASIVLQCRQKPDTFSRQGETMGFERTWPGHLGNTCPHVDDLGEVEWTSTQKEGATPVGLLIRVWPKGADPEAECYKSPVD